MAASPAVVTVAMGCGCGGGGCHATGNASDAGGASGDQSWWPQWRGCVECTWISRKWFVQLLRVVVAGNIRESLQNGCVIHSSCIMKNVADVLACLRNGCTLLSNSDQIQFELSLLLSKHLEKKPDLSAPQALEMSCALCSLYSCLVSGWISYLARTSKAMAHGNARTLVLYT